MQGFKGVALRDGAFLKNDGFVLKMTKKERKTKQSFLETLVFFKNVDFKKRQFFALKNGSFSNNDPFAKDCQRLPFVNNRFDKKAFKRTFITLSS